MEMQQGQPMEQGAEQQGGGSAEFIQNLGQGLQTLGELVSKTEGAPPEAAGLVEGIMQQFQQLIQVMSGEAAPEQGRGGAVPVQQAEGTPVGPQG